MQTIKKIGKILVPTDFSYLSLVAMEYAASFSIIYDAPIYMIHVIDDIPALTFHTVDLDSETILRDAEEKVREEFKNLISSRVTKPNSITTVVRRGQAHKEIVKFAQEEGIDLIVLATHGRTGLAHVLMGSVAEKVVRHSPVPVLAVKPLSMQSNFIEEKDIEEQLHMTSE